MAGAATVGADVLDVEGPPPHGDAARLRRMDRFGRAGWLAGSLALVDAGFTAAGEPDARSGVVFGTAYGCRDSITDHALLLSATSRAEELRPSLFAQTVHNTVAGELAIDWKLGGVSEVLVSGRTAGLEALLVAASRLRAGEADRVVAGGAEGIHARMREAQGGAPFLECGAALVLAREGAAPRGARGELLGGFTFFEPEAARVAPRIRERLDALSPEDRPTILPASPDPVLAPLAEGASLEPLPQHERFAAAGPHAAVSLLLSARERRTVLVVGRDPCGMVSAVLLAVTPRSA